MAGHGVELQRTIPNVMNGNVRIVALSKRLTLYPLLIGRRLFSHLVTCALLRNYHTMFNGVSSRTAYGFIHYI